MGNSPPKLILEGYRNSPPKGTNKRYRIQESHHPKPRDIEKRNVLRHLSFKIPSSSAPITKAILRAS